MKLQCKILVTTCSLVLSCFALGGCPQEITHFGWIYSIGRDISTECITRSPQDGYFVVGYGHPSGDTQTTLQTMILKLSDTGELEWNQFVADMPGTVGVASSDGGLLVTGYAGLSNSERQLHIIKRNQLGTLVWDSACGDVGLNELIALAMVATSDGGCVIAGRRYNGFEELPFVLKLDPQGTVVWERRMASAIGFLNVTRIVPVGDDGFIISGVGRLGEGRLLRVDADGNALWWKQYDGNRNTAHGFSVDVAPDGGFMIASVVHPYQYASVPAVIRTDADGNVLWTANDLVTAYVYPRLRKWYTANDVLVDAEGHIVIVGEFITSRLYINWANTAEGYIMQLDSTGHLNWYTSLNAGLGNLSLRRVTLTASGDYITLGQSGSEIQVVRVSKDGAVM